jgi:hypothetical protein
MCDRSLGQILWRMNSISINARRMIGTLALAALLAGAALAPAAADAAQPKGGVYAGKTTQSGSMPYTGSIRLKVVKVGGSYKLAKVTARVKLDCQGDPAQVKRVTVAIPLGSGKVSGSGRFNYSIFPTATSGFTIKGRFVTRTKASGRLTLGETSGCYVPDGAKWTASLL